jgi:LPS export ABC transporter protein LptC
VNRPYGFLLMKKSLLYLVLLALVGGAGWSIWSVQQRHLAPISQAPKPTPTNTDKLTGQNVSFTITANGQKKWELLAKTARYTNDNTDATLEGVVGLVYGPTGKAIARFTAPNGVFKTKQNALNLSNGVQATQATAQQSTAPLAPQSNNTATQSDDPSVMALNADTMAWRGDSPTVLASGHVRLRQPKQGVSTADRCHFTMDFNQVTLEGHAQSNWNL